MPAGEILDWAIVFLAEFAATTAHDVEKPPSSGVVRSVQAWVPSHVGAFKLNVDVSVGLAAGKVGLGLIIRNEVGQIMAAGSIKLEAFFNPEVAEALAIFRGLQLAIDSGLSPLLVESDVLRVIKLL
ncbi:hypothetical protein ACOSP7_007964 [Xanthoceras sorbifolium]